MKTLFDRKAKDREFLPGDLVLKWDARKEYSTKHGKFDHIWYVLFKVAAPEGKKSFLLEKLDGKIFNAPVNHYYIWADYSTKIFHASTSLVIFLNRARFSWIFPRKFVAISTKILI
jgi:hypothetical protein